MAVKIVGENSLTPGADPAIETLTRRLDNLDLSQVPDSPEASRYAVSSVDSGNTPSLTGSASGPSGGGSGAAGVSAWNGRTGGVVPLTADYSAAQVTHAADKASGSTQTFSGDLAAPNLSGTNTGDQTITLTGDVTGSGTGSFPTTLQTVNTDVGSYSNASLSVNGKGLITAASSGPAPVTSVTGTSPITSSGGATPAISLDDTAITPGTYGDATHVGLFTVDQKGRLTAASNVNISGGSGTVTSVSVVSANGFAGTVATPTTTPALTLETSVTGILYGNGTGVAAAVAANFPTLNQNTTGNAATVTTNADLTGPVTSVGNATAVTANAITNALAAQMAANTLKGNNTGSTANAADLTAAQVTALLVPFSSTLQGAAPASGGGTSTFLRADGTWDTPSGGGTVTSVSVVSANGVTGSVANPTTTPAITLTLGAITPASVVSAGVLTGTTITGTSFVNSSIAGSANLWDTGGNLNISAALSGGAVDSPVLKLRAWSGLASTAYKLLADTGGGLLFQNNVGTNQVRLDQAGNGTFQGNLAASNLSGTNTGDQVFAGALVYQHTSQSIPNATATNVTWDTESYKTNAGMHSTSVNPSRLIATSAGYVRVYGQVAWNANPATGRMYLELYRNGAVQTPHVLFEPAYSSIVAGNDIVQVNGPIINAALNDYFEIVAFQSSGAALTLGVDKSWMQLEYLV